MTRLIKTVLAGFLFTGLIPAFEFPGIKFSQPSVALAQDTIDVSSVGTAFVMPDTLSIWGTISGSGDVKEATKIISGLKGDITKVLKNEAFTGIKLSFGSQKINTGIGSSDDPRIAMMQMMGEEMPEQEEMGAFRMSESFDLSISGITEENFQEKINLMTKLATALNDVQIKLGSTSTPNIYSPYDYTEGANQSFLQVRLGNSKAAWKEASRLAFEDAKEKAETLAEISGGTLGRAVAISSTELGHDDVPGMAVSMMQQIYGDIIGGPNNSTDQMPTSSAISQSKLAKIAVSVNLDVKFSFVPKP